MISILLPAYNAERFIEAAIVSILQQTFTEFELIVIDDGSTDQTGAIVEALAQQDSRVRLLHSTHGGLSRALNQGIATAQYDWVGRMDADDIALPDRLQKQVEAIHAQPQVVAWGTYAYHINAQGKPLGMARTGPTTEEEFLRQRQAGHLVQLIHPTVLLRKDVLLAVGGYDPEFELVEELELFDRMAAYGATLAIPEPLLQYRVHSASVSMQKFFIQRVLMRYVVARHRDRLAGKPELSYPQFLQDYQQQPWLSRLQRNIRTTGMFYYRKAGLLFGEAQRMKAVGYLTGAIALHPAYSLPRLWNQVLAGHLSHFPRFKKSPEARFTPLGKELPCTPKARSASLREVMPPKSPKVGGL
ncbi:MAG: glycosyltransferase [Oculatellaceae cyanobacterium Prado106]|jgi:GT2 family glycosyltransferase|nr:glycosyltransferase [Oculatellaceae cyanobacterium Prado106]